MLKKMKLLQFKGFKKFEIHFGVGALLLGPNNAGKSTVISAIKIANSAAKLARRTNARETFRDEDRTVRGRLLSGVSDDGFVSENLRFEFQEAESRIELEYASGAVIKLVWPVEEPAFFWISSPDGDVVTAARAKILLQHIGLVPTLTPIDSEEKVLSQDYLLKNVESKLSSRHFRNALRYQQTANPDRYAELLEYLMEHTPELTELAVESVWREDRMIDLYFRDTDSQVRKELYWAGDGLQIWLQILYQIWRNRESSSLVLDEPDVFLHPDLQRRLVRVLEGTGKQIVMSSHAAEVASESDQRNLVWVERRLGRARRVSSDAHLSDLSGALGSAFNLSIARALKARVALFVEGQDMKILSLIARRLGAKNFATERRLAVTPIGGYSNWPSVESFGWLKEKFLGSDVHVAVLLDRDYRTVSDAAALEERMALSSVTAHVWRRKELESYLLVPSTISRVTGVNETLICEASAAVLEDLGSRVRAQMSKVAIEVRPSGTRIEEAIEISNSSFEAEWETFEGRLRIAPAKDVMKGLNIKMPELRGTTFNARDLAKAIYISEIDSEMQTFIADIEGILG